MAPNRTLNIENLTENMCIEIKKYSCYPSDIYDIRHLSIVDLCIITSLYKVEAIVDYFEEKISERYELLEVFESTAILQ